MLPPVQTEPRSNAVKRQEGAAGHMLQVESVAFSWWSYDETLVIVQGVFVGACTETLEEGMFCVQIPEEHGRFPLCK